MGSLTIGIVGIGGRGQSLRPVLASRDDVEVRAVCDVDPEALSEGCELYDAEGFLEYETMLTEAALDGVIVGTPVPYHVPQSIAALERDLHVLCEVPGSTSIDECRELVAAAARSDGVYTMTENFPYLRSNMIISNMVRDDLFGEIYFAEGEYLHDLKTLNELTPWRREWQTGLNGITYPTHSLGPILGWLNDRIEKVTCVGSGHHYLDSRGDRYEQEDTTVMLGKTEGNALIKVRLDMLSERPDGIDNYQLQGTNGCYESARTEHGSDRIWLDHRERPDPGTETSWEDLERFEAEYLPDIWAEVPPDLGAAGDGDDGLAFRKRVVEADFVMFNEIFDHLLSGQEPPMGIHEALDLSLPGLVSQQSINENSAWMPVPDSRDW